MSSTLFNRHILEFHWLADLTIGRAAQLHLDLNGLLEISVMVWRRAEHNGHLPVDVSLRERTFSLPGVLEETHLDIFYVAKQKIRKVRRAGKLKQKQTLIK